jgi:hypothetical protein
VNGKLAAMAPEVDGLFTLDIEKPLSTTKTLGERPMVKVSEVPETSSKTQCPGRGFEAPGNLPGSVQRRRSREYL